LKPEFPKTRTTRPEIFGLPECPPLPQSTVGGGSLHLDTRLIPGLVMRVVGCRRDTVCVLQKPLSTFSFILLWAMCEEKVQLYIVLAWPPRHHSTVSAQNRMSRLFFFLYKNNQRRRRSPATGRRPRRQTADREAQRGYAGSLLSLRSPPPPARVSVGTPLSDVHGEYLYSDETRMAPAAGRGLGWGRPDEV
jgi:hypothetical protein